jgi:hypothetical protein
VVRFFRDKLERYLAVGRFAEMGLFEDRRARERSLSLLVRCLTPAQRAEFQRTNTFTVRGRSGQRYRITYATTANVEALGPHGTVERRLCAGPMGVPIPSVMLAQKLMLENQESDFLRIAARGTGTTPAPDFPQLSG